MCVHSSPKDIHFMNNRVNNPSEYQNLKTKNKTYPRHHWYSFAPLLKALSVILEPLQIKLNPTMRLSGMRGYLLKRWQTARLNNKNEHGERVEKRWRDSLWRIPCQARRSWWPCWRQRELGLPCPWHRCPGWRRTWQSETWRGASGGSGCEVEGDKGTNRNRGVNGSVRITQETQLRE